MTIFKKIKDLSALYHNEVIEIRRHLHKNPELSFQEFKTSEFIQQKLTEYGIDFTAGYVKTGVVAIIEGCQPSGKCIALRADIDALPIQEKNNVEYCSLNEQVMHACGHDFHTASLLGVAKILNETKKEWAGKVKLIFQPGEETLPGGAFLMIEEGVLKNPKVDFILGQHVSPELLSGTVGLREGLFMASADELFLTVNGLGGHAAIPQNHINPLKIAAKIITALYEKFDSYEDTILSLGAIQGGTLGNIVPDFVKLKGTFRAMDENWRNKAHQEMRTICNTIAEQFGGSCELEIKIGYPFLKNDKELTIFCKSEAEQILGSQSVVDIPKRMTAEDFAFYSHHVPACFYRIGVGFEGQAQRKLHNSNFDVDEKSFLTSVELMASLTVSLLRQK
jgi:hippurate hydrolase